MSDCADILPRILELHSLVTKHPYHALTKSELSRGCGEYEAAMVPRAFTWVRKSGGSKVPVIAFPLCFTSNFTIFTPLWGGWKGRTVETN